MVRRVLLPLLLLCVATHRVLGDTAPINRPSRSLFQAGTARFMNAPIINAEALEEAGPAQPVTPPKTPRKQRTTTFADTTHTPPLPQGRNNKQTLPPPPQQRQQAQQQQQQRGLLSADSANTRRYRYDRHWRQERINRYRRYDRGTLSPWLAPVNTYAGVRRQPLPLLTGLLGSLLLPGNPQGTAQSLARAYSSGQQEAAAQAMASAAAGDGSSAQASTVAQAITATAVNHPNVAPGLLARSANLAVTRGQTDRYANMLANSFGYAKQQQQVPQLTEALCQAINTGGDAAKYASGTAIARAIAQGGDSKAAVVEATATALCQGGSQAQSWSSAYAIALSQDQNGCLVLNEAKAMAQAKCGDGAADAVADAEASSTVLGFCGLLEGFWASVVFPDTELSFSGGNSGSSSSNNGWGQNSQPGGWGQYGRYGRR